MKARQTTNRGFPCWCVQFTEHGKKVIIHRKTKGLIDEWIRDYKAKKEVLSQQGLQMMKDPAVAFSVYTALDHMKGKNYNLMDAIKFYESHHDINDKSISMEDGMKTFIKFKKSKNKRSRTIGEYSQRLSNLVDYVGRDKPMSSLTHSRAEKWIDSKNVSPVTKNHFLRVGKAFYNWAKKKGYTEINPFNKIEKYDDGEEKDVEIFTSEQIQSLLDNAENEQAELWIGIGALAGIRPAEMNRLTWDKIHLNTDKIDMLGMYAKGRKRRVVDIHPRLKAILQKYKKDEGRLFVAKRFEFSPYLKRTKNAVDFKWIDDGLRHSYASHHIALTDSADKTLRQMGHGDSTKTFYNHYYKPGITNEEGRAYFGIVSDDANLQGEKSNQSD